MHAWEFARCYHSISHMLTLCADSAKLMIAKCAHVLKGLALPRASHSGEIALSASRRLRSTLAAVPALFARAFGPCKIEKT